MSSETIDLAIIGYVTRDEIVNVDRQGDRVAYISNGGVASYFALSAAAIGERTGICSLVGPDFKDPLFDSLRENSGIDLEGICMEAPVTYEIFVIIRYDGDNFGVRMYSVGNILPHHVPDSYLKVRGIHIGALVGEVPAETVKSVRERSDAVICLDAQGYVRNCQDINLVPPEMFTWYKDLGATDEEIALWKERKYEVDNPGPWKEMDQFIPHINILKMNNYEICQMTGLENYMDALADLENRANRLNKDLVTVVTLGAAGSLIAYNDAGVRKVMKMGTIPTNVIDTIGGGDTYAAGFLAEYSRSRDPIAAGRYATAASSLVCEVAGPLKEAQTEKVQEKIATAKQVLNPEPIDLSIGLEN